MKKYFSLSAFQLKIIAALLMTLDHVALLFIPRGAEVINTSYYILRAIGKISFPIFVFLAVESVYHTSDIKKYLLRLFSFAIFIDAFGYIIGCVRGINPADNPLIGNVMTDLFLGVLTVHLLKKKNWYSLLAVLPIAVSFLTHLVINEEYGTLFKSDWGSFSIVLFLFYFAFRELGDSYLKRKALNDGLEKDAYLLSDGLKTRKIFSIIGLVCAELLYYLLWRIDYTIPILPNDFIPLGTYSTLAGVFLALYNGNRGYKNKNLKWIFYFYYPLHLLFLGVLSLFFGVLSV